MQLRFEDPCSLSFQPAKAAPSRSAQRAAGFADVLPHSPPENSHWMALQNRQKKPPAPPTPPRRCCRSQRPLAWRSGPPRLLRAGGGCVLPPLHRAVGEPGRGSPRLVLLVLGGGSGWEPGQLWVLQADKTVTRMEKTMRQAGCSGGFLLLTSFT